MRCAICLLVLLGSVSAQPAGPTVTSRFEVVSIKPDPASVYEGGVQVLPGGRLVAKRMTLQLLIQNAWGLKPFELAGGPGWMDSEAYDIEAIAAGNPSKEQMALMMRSMVEERFRLKYHRDSRQLPVYDLIPGKNGIRLRLSENGCAPAAALVPCGRAVVQMGETTAQMRGRGVSIAQLTRMLTNILGRPVIDKTGFTSSFDVTLDFAIDDVLKGSPVPPDTATTATPSLLTAIQEQMGLKLVPAKGPVEVLVVDRVERPTDN